MLVGSALRADLGPPQGGVRQGRGYAAPSAVKCKAKPCPAPCSPCGERDVARAARGAAPTRCKQGRTSQMISLPWVGSSALAQPRLTKGGQPYPKTVPCVVPFSPPRSPQFSPPISPLPSVICHRFSHPRCLYPKACTPPLLITLGILPNRQPLTASTYPLIRPNFSPAALKVSSFLAKWKRT